MLELEFLLPWLLFITLFFTSFFFFFIKTSSSSSPLPKSYPLIGSFFAISANRDRFNPWVSEILSSSSSGTFILHRSFGARQVFTVNPSNVQHILKTQFSLYPKGEVFRTTLTDFLGNGIFTSDGENWKFQRQIASHEFNTKSLRKFIKNVVKTELYDRLIPILSISAEENSVLDLQDILQRFGFDNICKISFGFDPGYLSLSLPQTEFAIAFEEATKLSGERFNSISPLVWKLKRALSIGSEKKLKESNLKIKEFAKIVVKQKKEELIEKKDSLEATDLLSRFLNNGNFEDDFVIDIVISFILAGRDTTSAALTWFFWLVSCNPKVEEEILKEINEIQEEPNYEDVKNMIYIHASLCESMRLYPPVPSDTKEAISNDILPDETIIKKGMRVTFHPYGMGRMENLWGLDWMEFKPERWLEKDKTSGKLSFIAKDSFTYPVFQAGPRICLGKEMAFLQMKMLVVEILRRFRVVPAEGKGFEPVFVSYLTSKMKGGFPVRIEKREKGPSHA